MGENPQEVISVLQHPARLAFRSAAKWEEKRGGKQREDLGTYELGEHGIITFWEYNGKRKSLADGTTVKEGDIIGRIDFDINLDRGNTPLAVAKAFLRDVKDGFKSLASDMREGKFPAEVNVLTGVSHLASEEI